MIKVIALLRRHPDMDAKAFRAYWRDVHAPLVRERLPRLIHYVGCFPSGAVPDEVAIGGLAYDAVVEMGFPDREAMAADLTSPAFLADDRKASSARFMDEAQSRSFVTETIDAL